MPLSTDAGELSVDVGGLVLGDVVLFIGESLTEVSAASDDEEETVVVVVAGGLPTEASDDEENTGVIG